jgi:hypothetical protein
MIVSLSVELEVTLEYGCCCSKINRLICPVIGEADPMHSCGDDAVAVAHTFPWCPAAMPINRFLRSNISNNKDVMLLASSVPPWRNDDDKGFKDVAGDNANCSRSGKEVGAASPAQALGCLKAKWRSVNARTEGKFNKDVVGARGAVEDNVSISDDDVVGNIARGYDCIE